MDALDDKYIFIATQANPYIMTLPPKNIQTKHATIDTISLCHFRRPFPSTSAPFNQLTSDVLTSVSQAGRNINTLCIAPLTKNASGGSDYIVDPHEPYSFYLPPTTSRLIFSLYDNTNTLITLSGSDYMFITLYLDYNA